MSYMRHCQDPELRLSLLKHIHTYIEEKYHIDSQCLHLLEHRVIDYLLRKAQITLNDREARSHAARIATHSDVLVDSSNTVVVTVFGFLDHSLSILR